LQSVLKMLVGHFRSRGPGTGGCGHCSPLLSRVAVSLLCIPSPSLFDHSSSDPCLGRPKSLLHLTLCRLTGAGVAWCLCSVTSFASHNPCAVELRKRRPEDSGGLCFLPAREPRASVHLPLEHLTHAMFQRWSWGGGQTMAYWSHSWCCW
jgi:hypothetical protein